MPSAYSSDVTGSLRRRSIRTLTMSLASNSKSSHEPRYGMTRAANSKLARRVRLALVMVEEDARRTVHLRDDDALGAVDDEGAVLGHERHVAHVDVLLLDVLEDGRRYRSSTIEHDQAQRHLQRRRIGHAALTAFVDVDISALRTRSGRSRARRCRRNRGSEKRCAASSRGPKHSRPRGRTAGTAHRIRAAPR
jgi:hypothetical protein